jgi:cholest-4-en-3-one 26-monooxygenase
MQTRNQRAPATLAEVDVLDPDVWVKGVPHEAFKLLRRQAPIYYHPEPAGRGFWTITKYDDLVTVSIDSATFSSYRGGTNIPDLPEEAMNIIRMLLINMDPPKHTRYRRLVSKGFTPKVVREMEPHVRQITRQIIDGVCEKGECDFVTEIAAELPLQVILEMMGVPMEDRHMIFDWSNRLIGSEDGEYATAPDQARFAAMEMFQYANNLASDRAKCPMDDIATTLINAEVAGERLSQPEFDAFFMLLSVAGNETTRNLISGAMAAFFEHPEQWLRLKADPSLMPAAVEEMLRWVTPVSYFRRTVTRDVVLRGQEIPEGDKVVMYYCSANRDEEVFPDGDVFDIGRNPNEHVTFGPGGAHFCLGSKLARLEIEVMFQELLRRLPDVEQAGPAQRLRSNFINGTKHLPVRFTPSKAKGA